MTEFSFDPYEGKLLVGQAAIELHREAGGEPVPLAALLEAKEFPYDSQDYDQRFNAWSREDAINWGKWVLAVIRAENEPQPLRTRHIRRLAELGLGPRVKRIEVLFDYKINNFKEAIESPLHDGRGMCKGWTADDFFAFATELHERIKQREGTPRRLTRADFQQALLNDEGPGISQLEYHMGGLARLNEHLGYPDIYGWDNDDFIAWGARLFRVNGEIGDLGEALNTLSRRKRGPSKRTVINRFGSLIAFRWKAEEELKRQETARDERLARCQKLLEEGRLPNELRERPEEDLLAAGARLRLYDYYRAELVGERSHYRLPGVEDASIFVRALARHCGPSITVGDIEATAAMLGLYGDLWPPSDDEALRLADEGLLQNPS